MSVKAMAWAWEQNVPMSTKGVLLALADHADNDGTCWPGVKSVAEKCNLSDSAVRYHLRILRRKGLLRAEERKREDGSRTSNIYHLPLNILTHPYAPLDRPPSNAEEGTLKELIDRNHQGTIIEPSIISIQEVWPDWYSSLYAIPGFRVTFEHAQAWLQRKGISDTRAEETALALKSKWPGPTKTPYRDPWATFQVWVKRPPLGGSDGRVRGRSQGLGAGGEGDKYEQAFQEQQRTSSL